MGSYDEITDGGRQAQTTSGDDAAAAPVDAPVDVPADAPVVALDCDHYGFVQAIRYRSRETAFQVREQVICSRCGTSFGFHVGRN